MDNPFLGLCYWNKDNAQADNKPTQINRIWVKLVQFQIYAFQIGQ